jgi:TPR repeat protein
MSDDDDHPLFRHVRELAAVNESIAALTDAVEAMPPGAPTLAPMLANLCYVLTLRFTRAGAPADLEAAIRIGRRALAATGGGPDDDGVAGACWTLGLALRTRFEHGGAPADLDEAVQLDRRAAEASAQNRIDQHQEPVRPAVPSPRATR